MSWKFELGNKDFFHDNDQGHIGFEAYHGNAGLHVTTE